MIGLNITFSYPCNISHKYLLQGGNPKYNKEVIINQSITMLKQILSATKIVSLATVLSFGLSYALAWTAPTATPPGANVAAPINTGTAPQEKFGPLTVTALTTAGAVTAGSVSAPNVLNTSATAQTKAGNFTAGNLTTGGKVTTGALQVTGGVPGLSKVLTSDASGNATWQPAAGGSDNLGNHTATQALNMAGNSITSAGAITASGEVDATGGTGTGYSTAPIEVRTTATPRLSFHWPGVVASQIGMDSAGTIRTYNNPGTGYANFTAAGITATGNMIAGGDVYSTTAGRWMSTLVGTTNIYSCPVDAQDCNGDKCNGQLQTGSTCYAPYDPGIGCFSRTLNCTLIGKLQPI
ncbi:MAG: hypothetical protein M0P64_00915 [Candidatus Pacebacteria bacterium]|nr:hypothetical protein [Candidatus Paceibacterota bacterium]